MNPRNLMNISLTPELDRFLAAKLSSGRYTLADGVVHETLHLLEEHDRTRRAQLSAFNEELEHRLRALDRGEHVNPEVARIRLLQKSQR